MFDFIIDLILSFLMYAFCIGLLIACLLTPILSIIYAFQKGPDEVRNYKRPVI